jgi:hypothetical protein
VRRRCNRRLTLGALGRLLACLGQQTVQIGGCDALQDTKIGLGQLGRFEVAKQRHPLAIALVLRGSLDLGLRVFGGWFRGVFAGGLRGVPSLVRPAIRALMRRTLAIGPRRAFPVRPRRAFPSRLGGSGLSRFTRLLPGIPRARRPAIGSGRMFTGAGGRLASALRLLLETSGLLTGAPSGEFGGRCRPMLLGQFAAGHAIKVEAFGAAGQGRQIGVAARVSTEESGQRLPGEHTGRPLLDIGLDPQLQGLGCAGEQRREALCEHLAASLGGQLGDRGGAIRRSAFRGRGAIRRSLRLGAAFTASAASASAAAVAPRSRWAGRLGRSRRRGIGRS